MLAPRLGSLVELAEQVGAGWLTLYDGALDTEDLLVVVDDVALL